MPGCSLVRRTSKNIYRKNPEIHPSREGMGREEEEDKLDFDSEIITFQIRTVPKSRLVKKIGQISETQLKDVIPV
jgi:hypothetical protein